MKMIREGGAVRDRDSERLVEIEGDELIGYG